MPIPSFFVPPRAVASVEQIRASLAAAREAIPALQQETVAAGMALAAELALDPSRQRIHARDQGMDMGALQRANSEALAKLRDQQDRITAMEAALPFAVERERREQAAATVKSDNMVRENRLRALDKRRHELVRDAEAITTCFENLRNRRRSLARGLADLEIKGVDIDQFMRETFGQVFSASAYQWKQLPLEGFANNVAGRIDHAKAELEATPKRSVEDELADMDANDEWQARLAARQVADSGRPNPAENVEALPPGMTRHAWSDVGGLVVGKAPAPKPPSGHVEPETTFGPDGQPMLLGDLPPKPVAAPQASETPDPSADASAEPSSAVDPANVERIAEPEPPELGTDNPEFAELMAKYRKPAPDDEWLGIAASDSAVLAASDSAVLAASDSAVLAASDSAVLAAEPEAVQ